MARILIVEDEPVLRTELRRLLAKHGHQIAEASTIAEAFEHDPSVFDLVLCDLRLPGGQGTDLIAAAGPAPVLIMTSFASVHSAVEAMKLGAVDYLSKPIEPDELLLAVERILRERTLSRANRALQRDVDRSWSVDGFIAGGEAMQEVLDRVRRVAPTDSTVLILGESGTGKELIARAIHAHSPRRAAAFVAVNCAAIPEGLIESELFGHEKGSFTGANARQLGLAEVAHEGTLFFDEIGELPLAAQGRLLRLLQEHEIRAVGAHMPKKVNLRVIAATHRDLQELVKVGGFREDLYFRLRVLDIVLPPLRNRRDELPELAKHLLEKVAHRVGRVGLSLSPAALEVLLAHEWPGNVRELENTLERAAILCPQDQIEPESLGITAEIKEDEEPQVTGALADYFRHFIETHQDKLSETELAKRLGISRKTLWERRQKFGLPRPR